MKLKDMAGNEHEFDPADLSVLESSSVPTKGAGRAPTTTVILKDGRTFVVAGKAGPVSVAVGRAKGPG